MSDKNYGRGKCLICKRVFSRRGATHKLCSDKCRCAWRGFGHFDKGKRPCQVCGKLFFPNCPTHKSCSPKCRKVLRDESNKRYAHGRKKQYYREQSCTGNQARWQRGAQERYQHSPHGKAKLRAAQRSRRAAQRQLDNARGIEMVIQKLKETQMTTAVVPVNDIQERLDKLAESLGKLTDEQVIDKLNKHVELTIENMMLAACCLRELERRGVGTLPIKFPLSRHLRALAKGNVCPELIIRFADYPLVLQRASVLPLPEQKRLASGGKVKLVIARDSGGSDSNGTMSAHMPLDKRMVDPLHLDKEQVLQVFAADHVRSEGEQQVYLDGKRNRGLSGKVKVEVQFTMDEMRSLGRAAKRNKQSVAEFLREIAKNAGAI